MREFTRWAAIGGMLTLALALLSCEPRRAQAHDIYSGVHGKNGGLCCGGSDCNHVEYRMRPGGAEFLVGGDPWNVPKEWVFVKTEDITFLPVPGDVSGDAHFCARLANAFEIANPSPQVHGHFWMYCAFLPPGGS